MAEVNLPDSVTPTRVVRVKLRERLVGHIRRQFACEYRILRHAGLGRRQAVSLCLQRYGKRE